MKKTSVLLTLLIVVWGSINMPAQNPANQPPAQRKFNVSPDNLKALQNSINLLTGQVAFPMNLVSLPGRGGLAIDVGIQYSSSSIGNSLKIFNEFSPTSVLGVGWSMEVPKIVADH